MTKSCNQRPRPAITDRNQKLLPHEVEVLKCSLLELEGKTVSQIVNKNLLPGLANKGIYF
mgnify:CR=1 FL=1